MRSVTMTQSFEQAAQWSERLLTAGRPTRGWAGIGRTGPTQRLPGAGAVLDVLKVRTEAQLVVWRTVDERPHDLDQI